VATAKQVLERVIPALGSPRDCGCGETLRSAVITAPSAFPLATRRRLALLLDKYFPAADLRKRPRPPARRKGSSRG
jgi:5'-methylthioadenosine phosphorylase